MSLKKRIPKFPNLAGTSVPGDFENPHLYRLDSGSNSLASVLVQLRDILRCFSITVLISAFFLSCERHNTEVPPQRFSSVISDRFGTLRLFRSEEEPERAAVIFSDADGWGTKEDVLASQLSALKFFIIGVDSKSYLSAIQGDDEECSFLAGEIERLIPSSEKGAGLNHFTPAALIGVGVGSDIATSTFLQHSSVFIGVLSKEPVLSTKLNPCLEGKLASRGVVPEELKPRVGELGKDELRQTVEMLWSQSASITSAALMSNLPLEVMDLSRTQQGVSQGNEYGEYFAVFVSGDGGWASIDHAISEKLNEHGIPVVGVDSLRYFWAKRSPEEGSQDLGKIIKEFSQHWKRKKVILIGFSFGAEVLPFWFTRLPAEFQDRTVLLALLSPGLETDFEIHISGWLGFDEVANGDEIAPELKRISAKKVLCIFGSEEGDETVCNRSSAPNIISKELPGDHHLNGDYDGVSALILNSIKQ